MDTRVPPFWVIFQFQLAWVLDFCLRMKHWKIQIFFEIELRLDPAPLPSSFSKSHPLK